MTTRPWAELIGGLTPLQQRKPVLLRRLSQFAQAPHIYWYPDSVVDERLQPASTGFEVQAAIGRMLDSNN